MDRRTYTFLVASAAFFFFYMSLRGLLVPQQPPAGAPNAAAENVGEDVPGETDTGDQGPVISAGGADTEEAKEDEGIASTKSQREWFTLGSMAPDAGYNFLITFCNHGAGIERIELTSREPNGKFSYRRVDTRSGYLGYFAPSAPPTMDGVLVNVVGPGTPAATAVGRSGQTGIQVGDVIVAVGDTVIESQANIDEALKTSKPGDQVSVEVIRGGATKPIIFDATLTEHPLDVVRIAKHGGADQIDGNLSRLSCLMTLASVNRKGIPVGKRSIESIGDPENTQWTASVEQGDEGTQTIRFETTIGASAMKQIGGEPVRLERTYTIQKGSYIVDMDVSMTNLGEEPQELAYRLEGANGITLEGWWYSTKITPNFTGNGSRDIVFRTTTGGYELQGGYSLLKHDRREPEAPQLGIYATDGDGSGGSLNYIGVDAQYFAVAYLPTEGNASLDSFERASAGLVADQTKIERHKERAANISFFLDSGREELAAGKTVTESLRMYAGPKEPAVLDQYGLGDFVYYGWFGFVSAPLSALLHNLFWVFSNYGISIVLLTVIVRSLMFPLSRNAAVNAQKMQELAPEMKKIAEKYKDDMEGRLRAQQQLQKKVGFNPMAGCLPMFLQLPIFMGLYRALSVDIELRGEPLWSSEGWCSNLAGPDQWFFWGEWMTGFIAGRGNGWLGPCVNVLPLFVVALFLTQQKMFMPPATDEQTAMTQKVMTFMTFFMAFFFFRVPAGLCIYFVASSLWGIGERLFVKRTLPKGKHFNLDDDVIDAAAKESEKPTFAEKILNHLKDDGSDQKKIVERPNKRKRPPGNNKKNAKRK
ncbi:MAG: YidC/Oxa1 family insertase periplasmic-domain containing protein [Planctomycetota bacterium]